MADSSEDPGGTDLISKLNTSRERVRELESILQLIEKKNPTLVQECTLEWMAQDEELEQAIVRHPANVSGDNSITWNWGTPLVSQVHHCTCPIHRPPVTS